MKTNVWLGLALACATVAQTPVEQTRGEAGPAIGTRIPDFEAVDQTGVKQNLGSIAGPKGAVLVFYRSADW